MSTDVDVESAIMASMDLTLENPQFNCMSDCYVQMMKVEVGASLC